MDSNVKKTVVALFFVGLLITPLVVKQFDLMEQKAQENVDQQSALERYGFYLEVYNEKAGISFEHKRPQLDSKLDHIMPQIASLGPSVTITDIDNDSLPDIYLTNSRYGTKNALYHNNGDGTFSNIAGELGIGDINKKGSGVSMGAVWGDYNNDGYEDLFVYKWGTPELFRNENGERFTRVTEKANLPDWLNANTAVWFDYNRDGLLDLYIGGYYQKDINLWDLEDTYIMPDSYEYATNGARNYLYENKGGGVFEDVTKEKGLESKRWTLAVSAADLNDSGYPDLVIANDYGIDQLYVNQEGKTFTNIGGESGIGFTPKSGMNVSFADLLNQGKLAFYITNISEPGALVQGNSLWVPSGNPGELEFSNLAGNFNVELGGWSYGGQFGDLNSDGFQDLYVANGYISGEPGTDYWYDFSKVAGGNTAIIENAKNWPDMKGRSLSGYQQNRIWLNDGSGKFREISTAVGGRLKADSRAVAFADFWDLGSLDIVVATHNGPVKVYRNKVADSKNWIAFRLEGTQSNRSAIGASVELYWADNQQKQVVTGGVAFSSQNQRALFFGLGKAHHVEKAVIKWPSGQTETITSPQVNKYHYITESEIIN